MERKFKVEGKDITLELVVVKDIPPYLVVRVKADDDTFGIPTSASMNMTSSSMSQVLRMSLQ